MTQIGGFACGQRSAPSTGASGFRAAIKSPFGYARAFFGSSAMSSLRMLCGSRLHRADTIKEKSHEIADSAVIDWLSIV